MRNPQGNFCAYFRKELSRNLLGKTIKPNLRGTSRNPQGNFWAYFRKDLSRHLLAEPCGTRRAEPARRGAARRGAEPEGAYDGNRFIRAK